MIAFRCPYCNKHYRISEEKIGAKILCSCKELMRVPRRSGGSAKYRSVGDRLIEFVVYGGGGAVLGFCFGCLCARWLLRWRVIAFCTVAGFAAGALGGERGVDWIGRRIRDRDPSL
jgi:hypothetical protein